MEKIKLKNYFYITLLCVVIIMAVSQGCRYDNEEELFNIEVCDLDMVSYQMDIVPIILQYCDCCHNSNDPSGGIILDSYMGVKDRADSGKLHCAITHGEDCVPMPQDQPMLPECEILKITTWIEDGANNN